MRTGGWGTRRWAAVGETGVSDGGDEPSQGVVYKGSRLRGCQMSKFVDAAAKWDLAVVLLVKIVLPGRFIDGLVAVTVRDGLALSQFFPQQQTFLSVYE